MGTSENPSNAPNGTMRSILFDEFEYESDYGDDRLVGGHYNPNCLPIEREITETATVTVPTMTLIFPSRFWLACSISRIRFSWSASWVAVPSDNALMSLLMSAKFSVNLVSNA